MTTTSMNDFFIEKILGRGSFGSVYLVRRKQDQKIYALKTVTFEKLNKRDQENSLNEVRILASINHPNVIGYKEAFWDDTGSSLNIVMEYADDGDLETKIVKMRKEGGMFNESLIWSYSIQMIEGLKALHDKNIMHRDIKSANIFLVKDNHQCKLGDMNVSKVIKEKVLRTQTGTPYYASPEVWRDEPYSYKSDLWSIGCVIYELCSLRPPFKGKDLDELYLNVCKGNIERISHIYSDELWKMILMLLQVDVRKRVDCKEFLDSELIMKKIKEMKENNSEFKNLEINKNSFSGTLLKTIKFKDYKDIKSQLPTKKNYDININDLNYNFNKENINNNSNNSYLFKNNNNNIKKNFLNDKLIEKLTNKININNPNFSNNIINNSNNINNYYYINYTPNYNQYFPNKINNNIISKKKEDIKNNDNYIIKTDINTKDIKILDKIDLNSIRNNKKKLLQKNDILKNYFNNKMEDDLKKNINEKIEKKLILKKQRQKEKERYSEIINQKFNEANNNNKVLKKSLSKQKLNHVYYNKIKNVEEVKVLKKRPASSSRLISSKRKKMSKNNNCNEYSSINEKKYINRNNIYNKFSNNIINENNNKNTNNKNLYIKIIETERNKKEKNASDNNYKRAKTPMNNYKKINNKNNKPQSKLNNINISNFSSKNIYKNNNKNNINSFLNINCMTSSEENKPLPINAKYQKINKTNSKSKKIDEDFCKRKNKKTSKNNHIKRKSTSHSKEDRSLSATPDKRNKRLNTNLYNNNNDNPNPKKILQKYDNYLNKDSYVYKVTKRNSYKNLHEPENNQQTRPIISIGNDYNKININNSKNNNYKKKDKCNNNELNNNKCLKINQNMRKLNSRQNSNKKIENENIYERRKNYRRYNPDITEPELLMMVNPIKIKDTYKISQKSRLNITVNNNAVNQNIFLHQIKSSNHNINFNNDMNNNNERNNNQSNICKYNHLQIFQDNKNNERNNDEPVKVIKIF